MNLIYKNNYGACFKMQEHPNPECTLQMVVDSIGIFMSKQDLSHLLTIVRQPEKQCQCDNCSNDEHRKIWCKPPLMDFYLKLDTTTEEQLEDLILGTLFILDMDQTLAQYRID